MGLFDKPAWLIKDGDKLVGAYPSKSIADLCSYAYDLGFSSRVVYGRIRLWERYGRKDGGS